MGSAYFQNLLIRISALPAVQCMNQYRYILDKTDFVYAKEHRLMKIPCLHIQSIWKLVMDYVHGFKKAGCLFSTIGIPCSCKRLGKKFPFMRLKLWASGCYYSDIFLRKQVFFLDLKNFRHYYLKDFQTSPVISVKDARHIIKYFNY